MVCEVACRKQALHSSSRERDPSKARHIVITVYGSVPHPCLCRQHGKRMVDYQLTISYRIVPYSVSMDFRLK